MWSVIKCLIKETKEAWGGVKKRASSNWKNVAMASRGIAMARFMFHFNIFLVQQKSKTHNDIFSGNNNTSNGTSDYYSCTLTCIHCTLYACGSLLGNTLQLFGSVFTYYIRTQRRTYVKHCLAHNAALSLKTPKNADVFEKYLWAN